MNSEFYRSFGLSFTLIYWTLFPREYLVIYALSGSVPYAVLGAQVFINEFVNLDLRLNFILAHSRVGVIILMD